MTAMMPRTALVLLALTACIAHASESYKPPTGGQWQRSVVYLVATPQGGNAKGACLLACNLAETEHRAELLARGLNPGGTYTAWLAKWKAGRIVSARPITSRWRPPHANAQGVLRVTTSLSECPATDDQLLVRYHAPGAPTGFEAGVTVLLGDLPWSR